MDKRSGKRVFRAGFHVAEIKLIGIPLYQFKLKDISENGVSLLVNGNSAIIDHLEVGQSLKIKLHSDTHAGLNGYFDSEIKHITKMDKGRYKKHYLVGLKILEKLSRDD